MLYLFVFFFKQKTAYEMRISDWSSDVCSSDLLSRQTVDTEKGVRQQDLAMTASGEAGVHPHHGEEGGRDRTMPRPVPGEAGRQACIVYCVGIDCVDRKSVV